MLVTTAISYTNGEPHIGHSFEWIIADVISRHYKRRGNRVTFLTGTDEHGQKIEQTAEARDMSPKDLCDLYSQKFKQMCSNLSVDYSRFIRTTDLDHKSVVYDFYNKCKENGDIYLGEYCGWYNPREETFVSELDAKLNDFKDTCTGKDLVKMKEPSYFFRLSKYQNAIKECIINNPDLIVPAMRKNDILQRLEKPLDDLSISRVSVQWGIPVPDDPKHVFYVWFDALVNYITGSNGMWPAEVHVIGKDITWFHTAIWISMLLSAGKRLPKHILVHGFVCDANGAKMSKSVGNVVSPTSLLEKYPTDAIRSYFINNFGLENDFHFSEKALTVHHDSVLLSSLGNLVNRIFGLVHRYSGGKVPIESAQYPPLFDPHDTNNMIDNEMKLFKLQAYADIVNSLVAKLNTFVNDTRIWEICNKDYPNDDRPESVRFSIIRTLLEGLYITIHYAQPIVPNTVDKICGYLGMELLDDIAKLTWNNLKEGHQFVKQNTILFNILDKEAQARRQQKKNIKKKNKQKQAKQ